MSFSLTPAAISPEPHKYTYGCKYTQVNKVPPKVMGMTYFAAGVPCLQDIRSVMPDPTKIR